MAEGAAQRRQSLIAHSKLDVAKQMGKTSPQADAMRANPAFKAFEGVENPQDVQRVVGGILQRPDAVTRMGQLRAHLAGTPAEEGLKRAVLDHILEKTLSSAEAGTTGEKMLQPGGFQKFIAKNGAALKAAGFSDEQLGVFNTVAGDLERQQRFNATKVRAGSDTAQNQYKSLKKIAEAGHHGSGWLAPLWAGKEIYEQLPSPSMGWPLSGEPLPYMALRSFSSTSATRASPSRKTSTTRRLCIRIRRLRCSVGVPPRLSARSSRAARCMAASRQSATRPCVSRICQSFSVSLRLGR